MAVAVVVGCSTMKVHLLCTCRKPELAPFAELVFKTLRIGFPTADVLVHLNKDALVNCPSLSSLCAVVGADTCSEDTIHHSWIERLIDAEQEPFWICDTDIIFYDSIEKFNIYSALAGWRIPEWQDEFSGAITRARLHTSLLYINPVLVKERLAAFREVCPDTPFTPFCNTIYPLCLPFQNRMYFYDTCSLLYHAIGGQSFTAEQKDAFCHMNFGSISDLVLPRLKDGDKMVAARQAIMDKPELGRGVWRQQMEYFEARHPKFDAELPIPPITLEDAKSAKEWNIALCKGDAAAMTSSDLWYQLCHGVDDIVDTMQDGRPKMSKAQILSVFFKAMLFYNSPFYVANQKFMFPTAITSHNMFADSMAWENSSVRRHRMMADVMRTCGNEMYFMIALLKGGESHMREMSPKIRDRDFIGQHDSNDNPN